jgi:hypothetical protein
VTTKVKVIKDVTVHSGNKKYGMGAVFDYEGDAVDKLVEIGFVEKVSFPPPETKTPEQKAAEKRKKAEEAAVKKGLGTAEEVAKLTDQELQELFKK